MISKLCAFLPDSNPDEAYHDTAPEDKQKIPLPNIMSEIQEKQDNHNVIPCNSPLGEGTRGKNLQLSLAIVNNVFF